MNETLPTTPDAVPSAEAAAPATVVEMTPAAVAAQLKQLFPALFAGGNFKPLKLRVQADIQERAPGVFTKAQLSAFLRRHTGNTGYLIALGKATHRYDLDGQEAGEFSDEHRAAAREELARRKGLHQERVELEQQQRRNRAGLLYDYERTTLTLANFCALKGTTPEELPGLLEIARKEAAEQPQRPPNQRPPRRDEARRPERRPRPNADGAPRGGERRGPPRAKPGPT